MTASDEYFREQSARLAAQVAKFANEAGYAQLVASVDAKDLQLNLAPDWPHWANMAYVTVSDAACLSLGISPEAQLPKINLSDVRDRAQAANADSTRVQLGVASLERAQRIIQQRVQQAMSAIGAGELPHGPRSIHEMLSGSATALVSLPRFRRWAESLPEPYVFPEGFPPAEPHSDSAVYSSEQPEAPAAAPRPPGVHQADDPAIEDDDEPDAKTRKTYLRTIRALAAIAKLIDDDGQVASGAARRVAERVEALRFNGPKERKLLDVLKEAAGLEVDSD